MPACKPAARAADRVLCDSLTGGCLCVFACVDTQGKAMEAAGITGDVGIESRIPG